MKSTLRTDVGQVRKSNEDAAYIGSGLYVLCDGMGGHQGGEVASNMAVDVMSTALEGKEPSVSQLLAAINRANEKIYQRAQGERELRGMGTTLTVLWASADQMLLGQVGDSRAYLLRGGVLRQCTHDHSVVAELVRTGKLTPEEARNHPQKNLVTRVLGTDARVEPDIFEILRWPGDRWLLCSDGLSDQVKDVELATLLSEGTIYDAADEMLSLALDRGAPDNITLVLMEDEGGVPA